MSCAFCVHWFNPGRDRGVTRGQCRRYPTPEATNASYGCGELLLEPRRWRLDDGANVMADLEANRSEAWRSYGEEKERRLALEKANKALRAELKASRAKAKGPA